MIILNDRAEERTKQEGSISGYWRGFQELQVELAVPFAKHRPTLGNHPE
jgi:hypothetical protein